MDKVQIRPASKRIWVIVAVLMTLCTLTILSLIANQQALRDSLLRQWDDAAKGYAQITAANITGSYGATLLLWSDDPSFRRQRFAYWLAQYPRDIRFLRTGRAFSTDAELRLLIPYRSVPTGRTLYEVMKQPGDNGVDVACTGLRDCLVDLQYGGAAGTCSVRWATGALDRLSWVRVPAPDVPIWEDGRYYYIFAGYIESDALTEVDSFADMSTAISAVQVAIVVGSLFAVIWIANRNGSGKA